MPCLFRDFANGVRQNIVLCLAAIPSSKENTSVFYCSLRFAIGISLMMDQVSKYSLKVQATQFVGETQEDYLVICRHQLSVGR